MREPNGWENRNPGPPSQLNGWARWVEAEFRFLRAEIQWRTEAMKQIALHVSSLESRMSRLQSDLDTSKQTLWAYTKPHLWKIGLGGAALMISRMKTGTWPDPVEILQRILGG